MIIGNNIEAREREALLSYNKLLKRGDIMRKIVWLIPLMLPLTDNHDELDYFIETCGGFVLTGGHDVSPELYNVKRQPYCGISCEIRDEMERYILKKSVELDKPVIGICRGIQLQPKLIQEFVDAIWTHELHMWIFYEIMFGLL